MQMALRDEILQDEVRCFVHFGLLLHLLQLSFDVLVLLELLEHDLALATIPLLLLLDLLLGAPSLRSWLQHVDTDALR